MIPGNFMYYKRMNHLDFELTLHFWVSISFNIFKLIKLFIIKTITLQSVYKEVFVFVSLCFSLFPSITHGTRMAVKDVISFHRKPVTDVKRRLQM